ncbi:MAG: hypothetical protein ACLSA6_07595 [Holdemania massiliensis]
MRCSSKCFRLKIGKGGIENGFQKAGGKDCSKRDAGCGKRHELAKDKLDQTKRQIELKRQLKTYEDMLNTAYLEIGRTYASAREENRDMPDVENWLEQVRTSQATISELQRQLAVLKNIE